MAFVAGRIVALSAVQATPLPAAVDVGNNNRSFTLYSHMRVPGGTTYTFTNPTDPLFTAPQQVVAAATDTVLAVPPGATFVTSLATSTVQLGQSV